MIPKDLLILSAFALGARGDTTGNTTCSGAALDWYTQSVGETPCTRRYLFKHTPRLY